MCLFDSPDVKPVVQDEKPPAYLRNPYLDALTISGVGQSRIGRNALRIDLTTPGEPGGSGSNAPPPAKETPIPDPGLVIPQPYGGAGARYRGQFKPAKV